jgi:hypothetical protein
MNGYKTLALTALAAFAFSAATPRIQAQISVSVGAEPQCPYGYYDYAPYGCSPSGYYGPQYFNRGVFIGVGPWFHGATEFHGTVNNTFDPQHGYNGRMPASGEKPAPEARAFKGNEERDGRGHVSEPKK